MSYTKQTWDTSSYVNPTRMNHIEDGIKENSDNINSPAFTEAQTRTNINSGESLFTILGKIKKFFTDLKAVAFSGSASDVKMSDGVTSVQDYISPIGNHQIEYIPFGRGWNGRAYTFIPLLNANKYTITITSAIVYNGGSSAVDITSSTSIGNKTRDGFNIDSNNTYVGECVRLAFTVSETT